MTGCARTHNPVDHMGIIVHVEVLLKKPAVSDSFLKNLAKQISSAFQSRSLLLNRVYQETSSFRVCICEAVDSGQVLSDGFIIVDEGTELAFHFYHPAGVEMGRFQTNGLTDDQERYKLTVYPQPNPSSSWDSLVYEEQRQYDILYELLVMQRLSNPSTGQPANPDILNCNRLVLLTGPPGTGKTTLCRALANKMAIRCEKRVFLAEINCQNILSKWFSESGKLIQGLFDELSKAVADSDDLIFILFDEIESLLINRANLIGSSEPSDSIRAVNALLTQLDRLKEQPKVFVLATSNFKEAIDPAFISRVDIHFETGRPGLSATYRIMTEIVEELIRLGFLSPISLAGYETCLLQHEQSPEKMMLSLCKQLTNDQRCSGRWLRKLAYPALKEAVKMNKTTLKFEEFIVLLRKQSSAIRTLSTSASSPCTPN